MTVRWFISDFRANTDTRRTPTTPFFLRTTLSGNVSTVLVLRSIHISRPTGVHVRGIKEYLSLGYPRWDLINVIVVQGKNDKTKKMTVSCDDRYPMVATDGETGRGYKYKISKKLLPWYVIYGIWKQLD